MDIYKYTCLYCNYKTNSAQAKYQHIRSAKHKKNEQNALDIIKTDVTNNVTNDVTNSVSNVTKDVTSNTDITEKKQNYTCEYCSMMRFLLKFQHKNSYYRHKKNFCKKKSDKEGDGKEKEIKGKEKKEEKDRLEKEKKEEDNKQIEILMKYIEEEKKEKEEQRKLMQQKEEEQNKLIQNLMNQVNQLNKNPNKETQSNVMDQSHNHTTTNNGTYFEATNQHNLLNNLNLHYNNVISMDKFLYNMEHVNKICKSDLEAIAYASENMSEGDLADTIHKTLEKNCREQTQGLINPADGMEMIPVLPVVCSDGNCRSHKEKVNKFWETVYGDKHFDQMLNVLDKRLYEVLQKKIYLEDYGKKKLFKMIKRKHTIHDMRKFQEKINGPLDESKFKPISI